MITQRLLIISAHADDHVACAGTAFKLQGELGFTAFELVLTNSELGQNFRVKSEISSQEVAKTRASELSQASKFLGIKKSFRFDLPDLGLAYGQAVLFQTVKVIRDIKPNIVFLHNPYDAHPDHLEAYKIGIHAVKIAATGVKRTSLGIPWRVPIVLCSEGMLPIKSQIVVDISKYIDKKIKLFQIYQSQANAKTLAFEKSLAIVRGYHLRKPNSEFAEAFTLQDEFPILFFEK